MPAFAGSRKRPPAESLPFPEVPSPGGAEGHGPAIACMSGIDARFF
jgi:hypothetical protein